MNLKETMIKKTVIFTSFHCNNNCRFCMEQDVRSNPPVKTEEIKRQIIGARKRGSRYLEMIGGEITIRPDFLDLVRFAKKMEFETVMIATNGRIFSYEKNAFEAINAGLNSIVFSIHGHNAESHDYLTRSPGSFDQLCRGVENIKKAAKELNKKIHLGVNTTIVKQNYQYLPLIGKHTLSLGIKSSEFIFVDCNEGGAYHNFEELVPRISDAAPYIRECLDLVDVSDFSANWDVRYVPLCYFTNHLNQVSELREVKSFQTEQLGRSSERSGYVYHEKRKSIMRIKPEECKGCVLFDRCEGLWRTYYEHYGAEELMPILEIKNN